MLLRAAIALMFAFTAALPAQAQDKTVTVFAAASMKNAIDDINAAFTKATGVKTVASLAASSALAKQIEQGAPADVFASANMTLPNQLHAKGLCSKPVVLTRNTLVIVVPKANPRGVKSVYDLAKPGIKLDVAGPGVPVGSYTLQILKNMNLSASVTKNVVSQETDVREVLAKVALGEADAGFVYSTDARTVPGKVTVLKVPAWAQPKVQYGICVVSKSGNKTDAQAFINKVLSRAGQKQLLAYGFLPRFKPKPPAPKK